MLRRSFRVIAVPGRRETAIIIAGESNVYQRVLTQCLSVLDSVSGDSGVYSKSGQQSCIILLSISTTFEARSLERKIVLLGTSSPVHL